MRITETCEKCLYDRQKERAERMGDPALTERYLRELTRILKNRREEDTSPYMVYLFDQVFTELYGEQKDYREIKREFNDLVLSMREEILGKIRSAPDSLAEALLYARIGNYIDFGAMKSVDRETFLSLFEREHLGSLNPQVYGAFRQRLRQGKSFVLITDNCGEIVLDGLFLQILHETFPHLTLYTLVRGEEVLNDATRADAERAGIDRFSTVIDSGSAVAGTILGMLPKETAEIVKSADVLLAKGQGNYETMSGCALPVFYSLLCKCDLFTERFQVPLLTGMFLQEGML